MTGKLKKTGKVCLWIGIFALGFVQVASDGYTGDVCHYFPDNTIIRDPLDCSHGIKCIDFKSVSYKNCTGSTPFFDKDLKSPGCAASLSDSTTCSFSCESAETLFIADPKSCRGYYYCEEPTAIPAHGHCPTDTHFNETLQMCTFSHKSNCKVDTFNFCAIVKNGVNFNDESACDAYYTCSKGSLSSKTCSKSYYDAVSGDCIEKSKVECLIHPLPKDVCGTKSKPKKNQFVGDERSCRGYYYCADVETGPDPYPAWRQCPANYFFESTTQTCQPALNVKCSYDRCDGRTLTFVVSGEKGCRDYLRCQNEKTVAELSCGNYFFSEDFGACVSYIDALYPACAK